MESYRYQPEQLPKAIIRRLQAALAPSLWPEGDRLPDVVTVDTLIDFMADTRVQEVLRTGIDDQAVLATCGDICRSGGLVQGLGFIPFSAYVADMLWRASTPVRPSAGFIPPCLLTVAKAPPCGPQWVSEIKHDGYRLMVRKAGEGVTIYTRRGADWTDRFPRIVAAARKLTIRSILIDGEGVVCGEDGVSDFNRLHSRLADAEVFLYGSDLLELDGFDVRSDHLQDRKKKLWKVLAA